MNACLCMFHIRPYQIRNNSEKKTLKKAGSMMFMARFRVTSVVQGGPAAMGSAPLQPQIHRRRTPGSKVVAPQMSTGDRVRTDAS